MLKEITWTNYFTTVGLVAAIYYLVIGWIYYRQEFLGLLSGKRKPSPEKPDNDPDDEAAAKAMVDMVKSKHNDLRGILEMAGPSPDRAELAEQLRASLANFSGLRKPAFQTAITNYIELYAWNLCGLEFSREELEAITAPPDG